ncbi:hypothetical protein RSOLAG1IB_12027 [Rhizoctonia solani AG-1 IB]|uniref:N-acetyltransferase domain-containing protein n=1 Tax=Thanatephorus cucumeris (strain AG1-IB / isolate 7/3/14) TaxID=1108050 RepID=A0A0B7FKY2_THACB|nr:hypothetical protein RSOLAG1IB_12027 [Rhizoctonia solani AG-1 IB]
MVNLISIAFASNPLTLPALGVTYENDPGVHNDFNRAQLYAALTGSGRVLGAFIDVDGREQLAGVSVWYGPGRQFLDDDEQRGHWTAFARKTDPKVSQWWAEVMLPRYDQLTREGLGDGVKKELLHLQVIGTHPKFQQRGVGKAMIRHMLSQVSVCFSQ